MNYPRAVKFFTIIFVCALLVFAHSSEAGSNKCARYDDGSIFSKFDKIILYFKEMPQEHRSNELPAEFMLSSMQRMAEATVIKHFEWCDLEIREKVVSSRRQIDEMLDSDNLVFYISLRYPPADNPDIKQRYALLQITPYRAGSDDRTFFGLLGSTKTSVFFPLREDPKIFRWQFQMALDDSLRPPSTRRPF